MISKRLGILALLMTALLSSCLETSIEKEFAEAEERNGQEITAYAKANNLTLTKSSLGVFYQKSRENATGRAIKEGEQAGIYYKLSLLDGTLIDSLTAGRPARIGYFGGSAISGFLESIAILKEGEKGVFLIPSSLAFANNPPAGVPNWSVLRVDLELVKIRDEKEQIEEHIANNNLTLTRVTASGLHLIRTSSQTSTGNFVNGDRIVLKYKGSFLNNTTFDSGDLTVVIGSGGVIKGFEEGVSLMQVGEKATIIFPSSIGYGVRGSGSIAPFTPLRFDLEIISKN
ncbi:MAG: FKBP-type peptidyl-prolyl cis-trans isomerase [Spirosomataceae bacterium]